MAIDAISNSNAYQAVSSVQVQTSTPSTKAAETTTTEGELLQNISSKPDATTVAVEKTHEAADDGKQSGENGQSASDAMRQKENERIKKAVEDLNKKMGNTVAKYGIHDETNRVTIKIVDKDTDKVIKELPPDKTLDMIAKVWEMAGILVDEKR